MDETLETKSIFRGLRKLCRRPLRLSRQKTLPYAERHWFNSSCAYQEIRLIFPGLFLGECNKPFFEGLPAYTSRPGCC